MPASARPALNLRIRRRSEHASPTARPLLRDARMRYRKHWIALGTVVAVSFAVLGGQGVKLAHHLPPIPGHVIDTSTGKQLFDAATIRRGQNVWQSIGGQEVG